MDLKDLEDTPDQIVISRKPSIKEMKELMHQYTDEERLEIMEDFCAGCGHPDPWCDCGMAGTIEG